ncbi:glycosyltransferase [Nesterenkonia sp. CF4.4]|uniref:glycosyltransferase n=1 Tax=Nesterenkonia sp. CF4.4 TaxID=3373079 RepID=UPI003EE430AF
MYDTSALTEDNELTLSVRELGYRVLSPTGCTVTTAMMPNVLSLLKQRRRWQRGALENLLAHGLNRVTAPYVARQFLTYLAVLFTAFFPYTLIVALARGQYPDFFHPLWITVAGVYIFEQTVSVRTGGLKAGLVSLLIVPELLHNIFLNLIYILSYYGALFATNEVWGRIRHLSATEFDKRGNPLVKAKKPARPSLHGTHRRRHTVGARWFQGVLSTATLAVLLLALLIPLIDLQLAWSLIAVYVITGFLATLGRLVPVLTS